MIYTWEKSYAWGEVMDGEEVHTETNYNTKEGRKQRGYTRRGIHAEPSYAQGRVMQGEVTHWQQ